ncbi:MAG: flagellar biosynthesis protein FlhA [Kineosporiaceae bacterium]
MTSSRFGQYAVPVGIVGVVMLLVVPIPALLLDVLIAINIALSLLALLTAMYVRRPLDFSVFPSLLLVLTLFRLGLNVASTRLVLLNGYAGAVIAAFGEVVIGASVVIGLVIFAILVVIQFAVITNGATRVAEVGARFTLDAMPGKQMAIDADLNAGIIDEAEAKRRREEISQEADFYGAMDGASKFVKGDAIAAVIVTLINLLGGFAVGMLQQGMGWAEALETYSLLTVGDGIVSQVPALLLSVATGLVVTRATTDADMGTETAGQLTRSPRALYISAGAVGGLALVPGLPTLLFLGIAALLVLAAQAAARRASAPAVAEPAGDDAPRIEPDSPEALAEDMRVDPLEIVLAADLVDLVDPASGGDLLERVRSLRRKVALELGLVLPPVRTRDSLDLPAAVYVVRISGIEVGRGQAPPGQALALGENLAGLPGRAVVEPVFGLHGKWIPEELRHQAELAGATVVDRASVVITHLSELVRTHAARLLSREDVKALADSLKRTHPTVVEELTDGPAGLADLQAVLAALLDERVPVRDLPRIVEAVSVQAATGPDRDALVEAARGGLGPAVAASFTVDGVLQALTVDPLLEQTFVESLRPGEGGRPVLALDPQTADRFLTALASRVAACEEEGRSPVLACAPALRPAVRRLVAAALPHLPVLSYTEAGLAPRVETLGTVSCAPAPVV